MAPGGDLGSTGRLSRLSVREFLVALKMAIDSVKALEILAYQGLKGLDADFISLVERPLFDSPGLKKSCLGQNLQMLASCGLAYAQLLGNEQTADAVFHQVPVHLGAKVRLRVFEPIQDLNPPLICKCPCCGCNRHIAN